jgi:uncharacterized protein (TIGR03000 family)
MLRKIFFSGAALLLTGATMLATPSSVQASSYFPYYPIYPYSPFGAYYSPFFYDPFARWSFPYGLDPHVYGVPPFADSSPSVAPPSNTDRPLAPPATAQPRTDKVLSRPSPAQAGRIAHYTVSLPADAQLWIGNKLTTATGSVRTFSSPPLRPGSQYSYDIVASWYENGEEVTQTQTVEVTPGAHIKVHFPAPPAAGHASALGRD